jgi:hypothetical protein
MSENLRDHQAAVLQHTHDAAAEAVERSELYGEGPFHGRELTDADVFDLYKAGIGIRLPSLGMVDFPLQPYIELGFHGLNLMRQRADGGTGC